jgi:hypothetical protein
MNLLLTISITALVFLSACAEERPGLPKSKLSGAEQYNGSSEAEGAVVGARDAFDSDGRGIARSSVVEMPLLKQDAVDYSFGVATIVLQNEVVKGSAVDRMLYVSEPTALSSTEKEALLPLCKDITLEVGSETELSWRSHYPLSIKRLISALMLKGQTDIYCVLRIKDQKGYRYLYFDVSPKVATGLQGSVKLDKAVGEGLMLLSTAMQSFDQKKLLLINSEAAVILDAKALAKDSISLSLEDDTGSPCWYDSSKAGSILGNPSELKTNVFILKTTQAAKVQGFMSIGTGGRILKNCAKIELASTPASVQAPLSCQTYQDIKMEGLEAGCQWELEYANSEDPSNSVAVPLKLPLLQFQSIDLRKSDEVLSLLPKSPLNPVRSKSATFQNFNDNQIKYAELAFDIWLAAYPKSFNEDFKDYVKTVTVSDSCEAGIGGFARLNSTAFTWCSPNLVVSANNPSRPVFHAILIAHETRHSRGWGHDIDDPKYTPCQGSAASASLMHAIVVTCKEDYCAVLRNAAVNEYILELNYSLKGDARRFQGQCKEWSTAMGLTDSSFSGAK